MTIEEYKEMYREMCVERLVPVGKDKDLAFAEFVAYRKRVEKYFDNSSDSS